MRHDGVPLTIGSLSLDPITMVVIGLILIVVLGTMLGVRRDIALGAFIAGALVIALTYSH